MTRVYEADQKDGGVRLLIIGAGHYPHAQSAKTKVPRLPDIASAAQSAIDFATKVLTDWKGSFLKPIASVDLLVSDAANPDGIVFKRPAAEPIKVQAPTLANISTARTAWLGNAARQDVLIFYCCGHGIWLPSLGRAFLASDFGADPDVVWPNAISIDLFIEGMGDKPPRAQWLIFDCCANQAPIGLRNSRPAINPLVESVEGMRKAMIDAHGPLAQAVVASALGTEAFGRRTGRSRIMDVFIEACDASGYQEQSDNGRWQISVQGLEAAMSTYRFRVASFGEQAYYTFPRLTSSDAEMPPVLMARDAPSDCTLLVTSEPPIKLKQCTLDIMRGDIRIDGQAPGPGSEERFRRTVEPFETYDIKAQWPPPYTYPDEVKRRRALPPLTEVKL